MELGYKRLVLDKNSHCKNLFILFLNPFFMLFFSSYLSLFMFFHFFLFFPAVDLIPIGLGESLRQA